MGINHSSLSWYWFIPMSLQEDRMHSGTDDYVRVPSHTNNPNQKVKSEQIFRLFKLGTNSENVQRWLL